MREEEDEMQKPTFLCHSHESGNPEVKDKKNIGFRYHGNNVNKRLIGNRH